MKFSAVPVAVGVLTDAQGRFLMLAQLVAQLAQRLKCLVQLIDKGLQHKGVAGGLQPPANTGKQHKAQLLFGFLQRCVEGGRGQLQQFGSMAEVAGLQDGLNHFDVA